MFAQTAATISHPDGAEERPGVAECPIWTFRAARETRDWINRERARRSRRVVGDHKPAIVTSVY